MSDKSNEVTRTVYEYLKYDIDNKRDYFKALRNPQIYLKVNDKGSFYIQIDFHHKSAGLQQLVLFTNKNNELIFHMTAVSVISLYDASQVFDIINQLNATYACFKLVYHEESSDLDIEYDCVSHFNEQYGATFFFIRNVTEIIDDIYSRLNSFRK